MGHLLTAWEARVGALLRDETNLDVTNAQIDATGLRPALAQFSNDRPRVAVVEQAGTGSPYLALPAGWSDGVSTIESIEYPARQNPPVLLDSQSWRITRDPVDVTVKKILLDTTPAAAEWVRLQFTAPWPFPTAVAADDLIDDQAFEAVCHLAASLACSALAGQAARARSGALPTDFVDGRDRARLLLEVATRYRSVYETYLGLASSAAAPNGGSTAPASVPFDFDPARGSLFHGGRR